MVTGGLKTNFSDRFKLEPITTTTYDFLWKCFLALLIVIWMIVLLPEHAPVYSVWFPFNKYFCYLSPRKKKVCDDLSTVCFDIKNFYVILESSEYLQKY